MPQLVVSTVTYYCDYMPTTSTSTTATILSQKTPYRLTDCCTHIILFTEEYYYIKNKNTCAIIGILWIERIIHFYRAMR